MGSLPSSFVVDGTLFCVSGGPCLVPGYVPTSAGHGQGALAVSRDGGQTWNGASLPAGTGVLQAADVPERVALPGLGVDFHHGQRRGRRPGPVAAAAPTGARRGRPPRHRRSTTATAWPAPRPNSAPSSVPTGRATRPSPRVRSPRVATGAASSPSLRRPTPRSPSRPWPARARPPAWRWGATWWPGSPWSSQGRLTSIRPPPEPPIRARPARRARRDRPPRTAPFSLVSPRRSPAPGSLARGVRPPYYRRCRRQPLSQGRGRGAPAARAWRTVMPKTCPQCQRETTDDANHCPNCGAALNADATTAQAAARPQVRRRRCAGSGRAGSGRAGAGRAGPCARRPRAGCRPSRSIWPS